MPRSPTFRWPLLVLCLVPACAAAQDGAGAPAAVPAAPAPDTASPAAAAPAAASAPAAAPPVAAAVATPADARPPKPTAPGLPPVEDACSSDAECGFTTLPLSGPHVCCGDQCGTTAGTKAWVKKLEAACGAMARAKADCPPMMCDAAIAPKPRCQAGRCALR
jgi:hypothetical protein